MNVTPVTPLTDIAVLKGVPLDSTYKNTLTFSSKESQASYFLSKQKYRFQNNTPVRLQNLIRLPVAADSLFDCNYVMWRNSNFSNKWFYSFIKKINYINFNDCEIEIESDVMQTWLFDFEILDSFVEREHVNDDSIGKNLIPESIEKGEYITRSEKSFGLGDMDDQQIVLWTTVDQAGEQIDGKISSEVYNGVSPMPFNKTPLGVLGLNIILKNLTSLNKKDAILGVTMVPTKIYNNNEGVRDDEFSFNKNYSDIDGYVPKNKKLFNYPYNFLLLTNNMNQKIELMYEFFEGNKLKVMSNFSMNLESVCAPKNYKGVPVNTNYSVSINNFPNCAYNIDLYRAWYAQNNGFNQLNTFGSAATGVASIFTGNFSGAFNSGMEVLNSIQEKEVAETSPAVAQGNNTAGALYGYGKIDFTVFQITITAQFAKIIDDFFSMYGYKVDSLKKPNIFGRKSWNYVKTIDCNLKGSIPFADIDLIKANFNKGITFWHNQNVGDYSQDNGVI